MYLVVRAEIDGIKGIMRDYGVSYNELALINDYDISSVKEGMLVKVEIVSDIRYVVMPFDSVESIAKSFGVTPQYIRDYNGINEVFLGDIIYIERSRAIVKN